jgi:hypothetical protein
LGGAKIAMAAKPIIPSLTGLRFYAAALVVWNHTVGFFRTIPDHPLRGTAISGAVGMTLFFVLSGFVIHYNYGDQLSSLRPKAVWDFLVARFARLYPLYLLALLMNLAYFNDWPLSEQKFWVALPYYATLTQDWFPFMVDGNLLTVLYVGAAWSISAEVMLYLFYFVLVWPMRWLRTTPAVVGAIVVLCVVATAVTWSRAYGWSFVTVRPLWAYYFSPYCRIPEFILGVLVAALFEVRHRSPASHRERLLCVALAIAGLMIIVGLFSAALVQGRGSYVDNFTMSWGYAPSCAAIIYCFARVQARWSFVADAPVVVLLGDASYSIYFLHGWFISMFNHGDMRDYRLVVLKIAVAWTLTAIVSVGVYRAFESPMRRAIRAVLAGKKAPQPAYAAAPAE